MSINQPPTRSARDVIKLKRPMSVAIYDDYTDAARAVDYLADRQFPVATLAIVGTDLKSVERVTGSMTWGKVLAAGFLQGAMWAGMFTVLMWLLQPGADILSLFTTAMLGFGLVGMAMSALQYRMRGPDRDYTSTTAIIATHYEVLAEAEYVDRARNLLSTGSQHPARHSAPTPPAQSTPPPQQADLDKLPPPAWPAAQAAQGTGTQQASADQTAQYPAQAPQIGQPAQSGEVGAPPEQPLTPAVDGGQTGASNQSYGQYWGVNDAPGIGDLPKRFGETAEPASETQQHTDPIENQSARRGFSP